MAGGSAADWEPADSDAADVAVMTWSNCLLTNVSLA